MLEWLERKRIADRKEAIGMFWFAVAMLIFWAAVYHAKHGRDEAQHLFFQTCYAVLHINDTHDFRCDDLWESVLNGAAPFL
jgi:hypothetical protein